MTKILLILVTVLPLQSFAGETHKVKCTPVAYKNSVTIEGTLNFDAIENGAAVSGSLDVTLKRVGEQYSPEALGVLSVSGQASVVDGLPGEDGAEGPWIAVKIDSAQNKRIQFMSVNLNLKTVNADSWVRTDDGVKYFANCQAVK